MRFAAVVALVLICAAVNPVFAAPRQGVLIEDFTNDLCGPCDEIQAEMDSIFALNIAAGKAVVIRPHVWWPHDQDPMYLWTPAKEDVDSSVAYYGVGYVPTFRYDGKIQNDPSDYGTYPDYYASIQPLIDSLLAVESPVRLRLSQQRYADSVRVSFDVIAVDNTGGGLGTDQSIMLFVMETNMNTLFGKEWYILRNIVPYDFSIKPTKRGHQVQMVVGDSLHFDWAYPVSDALNPTKLVTELVVQRGNQKVLNALYAPVANPTDVASEGVGPLRFQLEQNSPNPFGQATSIAFRLARAGTVHLTVYDASGRRVTSLIDGALPGGTYNQRWDGRDASGRDVSSGIYYYRLESENASETRKMTLLR
jgi:hypothetical protein